MAVVRDPAFWRRFSMAVHMDEEKVVGAGESSTSSSSSRPPLKPTDSWLERNQKKKRKTFIVGCAIAWGFLIFILALIIVLMWIAKTGFFAEQKERQSSAK